jgi:RecA/RadA recombinase
MDLPRVLGIDRKQIIDLKKKKEKYHNRQTETRISIGANNFDLILGGGLCSGNVYLVFGDPRTGKTQLCHQICLQGYKFFSDKFKPLDQRVILYFDTENTFRPERINQLAEYAKIASDPLLKCIVVSNLLSNAALLKSFENIEDLLRKEPIRIFLIDSINNHYRSEKSSHESTFNKAKNELISILEAICHITHKYDLITLLTAQVSPNFMESAIIKELPVGLPYLNHYFSEEIYLQHKEGKKCYAHIVNSHKLPERKLLYKITKRGIRDFKI